MGQQVELRPSFIFECPSFAKPNSSIFFIHVDDIIIVFTCFTFRDFFNFYVMLTFFDVWTNAWFVFIIVELGILITTVIRFIIIMTCHLFDVVRITSDSDFGQSLALSPSFLTLAFLDDLLSDRRTMSVRSSSSSPLSPSMTIMFSPSEVEHSSPMMLRILEIFDGVPFFFLIDVHIRDVISNSHPDDVAIGVYHVWSFPRWPYE